MATESKGQTVISFPEPVSFVIDLTIPKFSSVKAQTTNVVSDEVIMCKSAWALWVFTLQKAEEDGKEVDCIGAYLHRKCLDKDHPEIHVEFDFSVIQNGLPSKAHPKLSREFAHSFPPNDNLIHGVRPYLLHSDIWGDNAILQLTDDTLTVRVVARCTVLKEDRKFRTPLSVVLQERNSQMYARQIGRDFVLVSSEGTEHKVNKNILSSASPVFRRMLVSNLNECKSGRCEIKDIDGSTLEGLLRFMYLGCVEATKGSVEGTKNLLKAADKYEVLDLKNRCEDALLVKLNMDNVVDLLLFAAKVSAPELRKASMRYMALDPEKTMASEGMKDLIRSADVELTTEVFTAMLKAPKK